MEFENALKMIRDEAESLDEKVEQIDEKADKILKKEGISGLNKIKKLEAEKTLLKAQSFKLYEILGKICIKNR